MRSSLHLAGSADLTLNDEVLAIVRIADGIEGEGAGDACEILQLADGLGNGLAGRNFIFIGLSGILNGLQADGHGIKALGGKGLGMRPCIWP